jgi:hypothetical protein
MKQRHFRTRQAFIIKPNRNLRPMQHIRTTRPATKVATRTNIKIIFND